MSLLPPSGKPNWVGHLDWKSLIEGRTKSAIMLLLRIHMEVAYFDMNESPVVFVWLKVLLAFKKSPF